MRFYWEVLRSAHAHHALLLGGFAFDHAHHALLLGGFAFDHACLFSFVRKRETACGILRSYSARVGIAIRAFSKTVRLSDLFGSLLDCAFLYGDPDGVRGNAETRDTGNGVGGAVCVRLCVNLLALPCFPRGVRWWLRAPKPAPKSLRLSGLSSFGSRQSTSLPNLAITDIPEQSRPRPATLGYTERPDRLQFMAGQVGLYSDHINALQRPDSSRPQAARSRVAAREAVWKPHCGRVARAKRCGSRTAAASVSRHCRQLLCGRGSSCALRPSRPDSRNRCRTPAPCRR